jgi:hypothetical protein
MCIDSDPAKLLPQKCGGATQLIPPSCASRLAEISAFMTDLLNGCAEQSLRYKNVSA